jgi:hypothetical protein
MAQPTTGDRAPVDQGFIAWLLGERHQATPCSWGIGIDTRLPAVGAIYHEAASAYAQIWDESVALCQFGKPDWMVDEGILGLQSSPIHRIEIRRVGCRERRFQGGPPGYPGDCWEYKCSFAISLIITVPAPRIGISEAVLGVGYTSCTGRVCCGVN